MPLRVGDNHCHLNPLRGMGARAFAKRFREAGGWFVGLVNLTSWSYGVKVASAEDYERVYKLTLSTAEELRQEGLQVAVILGPHPAELARLVEAGVGVEKAAAVLLEAYRLAAQHVKRGEAAGLGEVGRPHWRAPQAVVEACNHVLDEVVVMAEELGCVVHFHVERLGKATVDDLASRVRGRGGRYVYHHAEGAQAGYAARQGLTPSVPAVEGEVSAALRSTQSFVVESDFLDDPRRPGAVVAPWSIQRLFNRLASKGQLSESTAHKVLVENIAELYGVEPG
uniref:Deoxyribonuclease n=1 Tax=Thermofilum pendens TaxID=2269 RepID=A0A7J3X5S3_THEPE